MPTAVQSYAAPLTVQAGRGASPVYDSDPYNPAVQYPGSGQDIPSYHWHWQASLPAVGGASWIAVYSSIMLRASGGEPYGNDNPFVTLDRAYSFDGADPGAKGWTPHFHHASAPISGETGPWILTEAPPGSRSLWTEIWLTEALCVLPYLPTQKSCSGFDWWDSQWKAVIGNNGGFKTYYVKPFPTTVDLWFMAPAYSQDPDTGHYLEVAWTIADQRVIVVACQGLKPGVINAGDGPGGVRPRGRIVGQSTALGGVRVSTTPTSDWIATGATEYNDAPPGAGNLEQAGYHFAELGTARRTDGGATGVGWLARALNRPGELPMGFQVDIEYNGRVITADKQDRGYGQGGDGITSDPGYAIDLWDGSGSGWADAPGDLGFPGKAAVRVRAH